MQMKFEVPDVPEVWSSNFLGFKWVNLASQSLEREIPKDEEAAVVLRIIKVPNN